MVLTASEELKLASRGMTAHLKHVQHCIALAGVQEARGAAGGGGGGNKGRGE